MLMTVMGRNSSASYYGELAGVRVLITGLSPACGVDVARTFADHRGRLVVHATAPSPELDAVTTMLAETASEVKLFTDACREFRILDPLRQGRRSGLRRARRRHQSHSDRRRGHAGPRQHRRHRRSRVREADASGARHPHRRQPHAADAQRGPRPQRRDDAGAAHRRRSARSLASSRSALAAVTRGEAQRWAPQGIRVNAVGPSRHGRRFRRLPHQRARHRRARALSRLAPGRTLTGQMFDAAGVAKRGC